jgi:hypothetical protein
VEPLRLSNDAVAQKVSDTCVAVFKELENTLIWVEADGVNDETRQYKSAVGNVLGALVLDVMGPLYAAHPEVKPESWKDITL